MSTRPFVKVDMLCKEFVTGFLRGTRRVALQDVSLRLERGGILQIIGENGSGKTTLLKILATLLLPTSGVVEIDHYLLPRGARAVRPMIGYMANDDRSFFWRLSVGENLRFFGTLQNWSGKRLERRVHELSERLSLRDILEERYDTISTGMKRRVAVVRALLHDPSLYLLDEPFNSLDATACEIVSEILLEEVASRGKCAIIVLHQGIPMLKGKCEVAFIQRGRIQDPGNRTP